MKQFRILINGVSYAVEVEELHEARNASPCISQASSQTRQAEEPKGAVAPVVASKAGSSGGKTVTAPMPGTILSVNASSGMAVSAGDVLAVLEAMKMENEITAQTGGIIKEVLVDSGSLVQAGEAIIIMA